MKIRRRVAEAMGEAATVGLEPPPPKKVPKTELRRRAIAAWWSRVPWPCVILSVDPGAAAGASIIVSGAGGLKLYACEAVDLYDPHPVIESVVKRACDCARHYSLPLVGVLEDWGRGGPRGLAQWIGLGEARGPWRRALIQRTKEAIPAITMPRIILARQTRWRSMVIPETGRINAAGKWEPFGPDGWKAIAKATASDYFLESYVPPEDAAESACMGAYAARSDAVGKALGSRHLKHFGLPENAKITARGGYSYGETLELDELSFSASWEDREEHVETLEERMRKAERDIDHGHW